MAVLEWLEDIAATQPAVLVAVGAGLVGLLVAFCFAQRTSTSSSKEKEERKVEEVQEEADGGEREEGEREEREGDTKPKKSKVKNAPKAKRTTLPSHPLLVADFKGHTGAVLSLEFDNSGKYLVSCSEDRTIRLWHMKTLEDKEHKYSRKNIELDHATHVRFSPDGTAILAHMAVANTLQVFKISKQKKSLSLSDPTVEFPKDGSNVVISIGIASTGKFVMTCTATAFSVWTLKGEVLATVETKQSPNSAAAVSPCGKFVACSGFTPDVKIWEVEFSKAGEFQKVTRAMELKGHDASVLSIAFSGDSHRMASVSKDGTWKLWDIDVRYKQQEDPREVQSATVPEHGPALVSLAPDARVVAVAINTSLFIYATSSGSLVDQLTPYLPCVGTRPVCTSYLLGQKTGTSGCGTTVPANSNSSMTYVQSYPGLTAKPSRGEFSNRLQKQKHAYHRSRKTRADPIPVSCIPRIFYI